VRRDTCAHLSRSRRCRRLAGQGFWLHHPSPHRQSPHPGESGEGCFTIAEGNVAPNNSHIVQVRIEDANDHCERARQNGAIVLTEPQDQPYGERSTTLRTSTGTAGTSPKPSPMSLPKNGVTVHFMLSVPDFAETAASSEHGLEPSDQSDGSPLPLNISGWRPSSRSNIRRVKAALQPGTPCRVLSYLARGGFMENRALGNSSTANSQSASTHHESHTVWVMTAYAVSGLALFGVLVYYVSAYLTQ